MLIRILVCLFLIKILSGCADRSINTCPPVVEYSQDFQNKAADELDALPPGSALGQLIVDYTQERAALRACHSG